MFVNISSVSAMRVVVVILTILLLGLTLVWYGEQGSAPQTRLGLSLRDMEFTLRDQDGQPVGPQTLEGGPAVVFFGFTHCPDVCPTSLFALAEALETLGVGGEDLQAVFISVDAVRDTPETLKSYVEAFHPGIQGWSGSAAEIGQAAQAFKVYYKEVVLDNGDVTFDHSASLLLFDAEGEFVGTSNFQEEITTMTRKLERIL